MSMTQFANLKEKLPEKVVGLIEEARAEGFSAYSVHGLQVNDVDPFLTFDRFTFAQPIFAPHPHAGMSAVTYLLPESPAGVMNRDSLGNAFVIEPGSINWFESGSGAVHEETPEIVGKPAIGLQLFVNLPTRYKTVKPRMMYHKANTIPDVDLTAFSNTNTNTPSKARVVVGTFAGPLGNVFGPLGGEGSSEVLSKPVMLLDVNIAAGATVKLPISEGHRVLWVVQSGSGLVGSAQSQQQKQVKMRDIVTFSTSGGFLEVTANKNEAMRALLLAGEPIKEPVAFGGPFCMNTRSEVMLAYQKYQAGGMGVLTSRF